MNDQETDDELQIRIDAEIEAYLIDLAFQESVGNHDDDEYLVFTPDTF